MELENRVLRGVRERLLSPSLISRFAGELQKELNRAVHDNGASRVAVEVTLADTRSRIAKLVQQMEENEEVSKALIGRLKQLEETEARLGRARQGALTCSPKFMPLIS